VVPIRAYPNYSVFLNGSPIFQNEIESNDSGLLSVVEPVSASGSVPLSESAAVNEPANLLGLGAAGLAMVGYRQSKRSPQTGS